MTHEPWFIALMLVLTLIGAGLVLYWVWWDAGR